MSATEAAADEICASCGITGGDDIKLKNCTACKLVKYCGVECQRNHRSQHKRACKEQAAVLKDELLFKQPESSHLGDCPICLLHLPFAKSEDDLVFNMMPCCCKVVCTGCFYANRLREKEARLPPLCPFCRTKLPTTKKECHLNKKKRAEANDPAALFDSGMKSFEAGDYATAIEYWEKAAELGNIESHYQLSCCHKEGDGVEQDMKKATYHTEQAAIGGHPIARHNLGVLEEQKGNTERAAKHFIIAANLGLDRSLQALKWYYARGLVIKEVFAAALSAHQAAIDAIKSPQRDVAAASVAQWKKQMFPEGC